MNDGQISVYDFVGGEPTFRELVRRFYDKIEADPELRAVFPDDLDEGREWQALFLIQYFGGPDHYMAQRGHPRLRMRHAPFPINTTAREKWLRYMLESIDEVGIREPARAAMRDYFERASEVMINQWNVSDEQK